VIEKPVDLAGGVAEWGIQKVNDPLLPSRGIRWVQSSRYKKVVGQSSDFWVHSASLSIYQSFRLPARVTFAFRVGAGVNSGDYAFNLSQVLDGKTELRGFRKTRFYGDKKLFFNNEVRVKLASIRSYLFPASVGVLAFHDLGRVWYKDETGKDPSVPGGKSYRWHKGFGGGLWFTPFNATVASIEVGRSREGTVGYIRLGFLF
jgi:hemolysin activation/secretion protein